MNIHFLVVFGVAFLAIFFCLWMIRRTAKKAQASAEQRECDAVVQAKVRAERAYRHQRAMAMPPADQKEYYAKQERNLAARNEGMTNSLAGLPPSDPWPNGAALMQSSDYTPDRMTGMSNSLAAPYTGGGGTFDGGGASGDYSSPSSSSSSSDSGSSDSESSSSSSSD